MIRRLLCCLILLCGSMLPAMAHADEASKRAKVEELFALMHLERLMNQVMEQVRAQTTQMLAGTPGANALNAEQKKVLAEYQNQVQALVGREMGWEAIRPEMVSLYASTYSEPEIEGILAFYKSPAGTAMLAKTPELAGKSLAISQGRMKVLQPELQDLARSLSEKLEAAGNGKQEASPSAPAKGTSQP